LLALVEQSKSHMTCLKLIITATY